MRSTLFLSLFALAFAFCAAQQLVRLTPQSLSNWTVTGADKQALSVSPNLALPAGARLTRSFNASGLALMVTTRPRFDVTPAEWPVLEIGTAALVFTRNGDAGLLNLVLGDNAPVDLPLRFTLDDQGYSVEPITINFARTSALVSIEVAGQTMYFPAGPIAGSVLDVVASAGASQEWAFDKMEVTVQSPDLIAPADDGSSRAKDTLATETGFSDWKTDAAVSQLEFAHTETPVGPDPSGEPTLTDPANRLARASTLEIFTPPAVRPGRAAAVRAALAGQKQN